SGRHALLQLSGARGPVSRLLYFDCFSGISGDMTLGALLDAGLPLDDLRAALGSLTLDGVELSAERVLRAGVSATKFSVHEPKATAGDVLLPPLHLPKIFKLFETPPLPPPGRDRA